jgi:hypothetical protein
MLLSPVVVTYYIHETRGCVSHGALAIYIKKYLTAKEEEIMKTPNISGFKNIIFKKSSKRNQKKPSRYYYN